MRRPQRCLFCQPIPSMPLAQLTSRQPPRSPQPQKGFLTGPEPRPLPGLRYQGNFSISSLSLQIRPLAEENKGLFMGSRAHLLLLHCIFYALSLKAFFTDKSPCLRPYRWHQRKAQKVKWFSEGRWKSQSRAEKGTKEGLPAPRSTTCHSWEHHLPTPRPGCQHQRS